MNEWVWNEAALSRSGLGVVAASEAAGCELWPDTRPRVPAGEVSTPPAAPEYDNAALREAWQADEVARLGLQVQSGVRVQPATVGFSAPGGDDDHLDDDVIRTATFDLAGRLGVSFGLVADAVDELAASRDPSDRAAALVELAARAGGVSRTAREHMGEGAGLDPRVAEIIARNGDVLSEYPARPAPWLGEAGRRGQWHVTVVEDEDDYTDRRQPSRGGVAHPEVARMLREHGALMGINPNTVYPVRPAREREAAEQRARPGHQAGLFSMQQLRRGALRSATSSRG